MKRLTFALTILVTSTLACSLSAPATRQPPAHPTASPSPAESTPTPGSGAIAVSELVETDDDILGMYKDDTNAYNDVIAAGAKIVNLEPMHTFFVVWVPDGYEDMATRRVMVLAHGHTGSSYFQMAQELEFARKYGYAVVAIQWWTGVGEQMYSAEQVYAFINTALQYMAYKYNAQLDKCACRGWSLGSEISFQLAYLDRVNGAFTTDLYNGVYGDDAFEGRHFCLYAGKSQAKIMHHTAEVIPKFGGVVEQLVEDLEAGHDGFFVHPQYHEEAIEIFLRLAP
ncbi:MAG: hypothetical protein ACE5OS_14555 [Anaerolineae bacterium]